jgi:hypothetical protein
VREEKMIELGKYYLTDEYGLIRTICRATEADSLETKIGFVMIGKGGYTGSMLLLGEDDFKKMLG